MSKNLTSEINIRSCSSDRYLISLVLDSSVVDPAKASDPDEVRGRPWPILSFVAGQETDHHEVYVVPIAK